MNALACRSNGLTRSLSHNGRMVTQKAGSRFFSTLSVNLAGRSRRMCVSCAYEEDYQVVEKERQVSSLDLKLQSSTRRKGEAPDSTSDGGAVATPRVAAAAQDSASGRAKGLEEGYRGRLMDAVDRVSGAIGMSKEKLAVLAGAASLGLLVSGPVLSSLELLPFVPEAMQTVGVAYSVLVASRIYQGRPVSSMPVSPFKAVIEMVEGGSRKVERTNLVLPDNLEAAVKVALENLAKERDAAVNKLQLTRTAAEEYARVAAEKEALEAVAMQLAEERDSALSEVAGLKSAVVAMTERMRAIEELLDPEVSQLRANNSALETISLQLAGERDAALEEVMQLQEVVALAAREQQEKEAVEEVAAQLAQERDVALFEIQELRLALASLGGNAAPSGLTPEQEGFIKARARATRAQFLDEGKSCSEQEAEVERFVQHLVQEHGAPREWVADYVRHISDPKPVLGVNGALSTGEVRSVHVF